MTDIRPDLDVVFDTFGEEVSVTVPGGSPVATKAVKQEAFNERFPGDVGNFSMTKGRERMSLRLDDLGLAEVPRGTLIVIGSSTYNVEATDVKDDQLAHVLVRLVPAP